MDSVTLFQPVRGICTDAGVHVLPVESCMCIFFWTGMTVQPCIDLYHTIVTIVIVGKVSVLSVPFFLLGDFGSVAVEECNGELTSVDFSSVFCFFIVP